MIFSEKRFPLSASCAGAASFRTFAASAALLRFARLDPRAFDQLCHAWQVGGEQARMRLRRQLVVREWQGSELLELLQEFRLGQRRAKRRIQRAYRFPGRALCHIEPM